ncbi:MAG: PDZ domain-containing protein [Oscillospiraceae bacterium]|nr:PDZ domain-containing protein [Oscillospiraceae bacterium]
MKKLLRRFLAALGRFLSRLFNYGIPLKFMLILLVLVGVVAVWQTYSRMMDKVGGKEDFDEAMHYIEIKDAVSEHYIDEADRAQMGRSAAYAMVSELGDKWSYYMSPDEYKSYKLSSANEYSGIGMSISKEESGYFRVISVNAGSAAADAGVSAGMILTSVDGENIKELSEDQARTLIRSRLNTKFTLGVSGGDELTVDCTRTHQSAVNYRKEKTDAGYVQIYNFEAGSADEAIDAIEKLLEQNIVALCIDVRGNPGGLASETQKLLDYLLPAGTLFYTADRKGNEEAAKSDSMCIQLPMVVMINSGTYAEAEVFAACMQEYQWATLFGETTTGSTRDQETIELSDGSAIRLSTKSYLTPNHVDISVQGGVVPEMIIYNSDPSTAGTTQGTTGGEQGTASVSNDEQLMSALTFLSKTGA